MDEYLMKSNCKSVTVWRAGDSQFTRQRSCCGASQGHRLVNKADKRLRGALEGNSQRDGRSPAAPSSAAARDWVGAPNRRQQGHQRLPRGGALEWGECQEDSRHWALQLLRARFESASLPAG